ncbi:hypothetical protein EON65_23805 [archaeon]|nr:MAG: hypothetical protein EON65_23805 [archaeon]
MSTRGRDADIFLPPPLTDSPSQSHSSNAVDLLNPLMRLKDALEGAQKNTRKMITKLEKFEKRLDDLDQHMQPIQESTKQYTLAKDNITAILTEVNKTYEYFRVANDVKDVISQGITVANQKDYFDSLVKLSRAKQFFESHREMKSSASVLSNIDSLFEKAVEACTKEFEKLLGEIGPAAVSLYEGGGGGRGGAAANTPLFQVCNPIAPEAAKQLKSIIDTFGKLV